MKLLITTLVVLAATSCATRQPSPQSVAAERAIDALLEADAQRMHRAAQAAREASARGPIIRQGYLQLQEGLTESQVDALFQGIAYTPSQEICGHSAGGPLTCRVRKYYGLIDKNPIEARIVFSRNNSDIWTVIAWE